MDTFAVLKDGTSFDRKRFAKDISLFKESLPHKKLKTNIPAPQTENIRKEFHINCSGEEVPSPVSSFPELFSRYSVPLSVQSTLNSLYTNLTPVQMQAMSVLFEKRDLMGIAATGSGKTLSFAVPLISLLKKPRWLRALVVAPTKELASQLHREFLVLSEGTGLRLHLLKKNSPEHTEWKSNFDIMFTTPLLFIHKLGAQRLKTIKYIVLDESDQLFDMGYLDQIDSILRQCSRKKQLKALFSATMLPGIEIMAKSMLVNPIKIVVGTKNATVDTLKQELKFCSNEQGKLLAIKQMIELGEFTPPMLIFVQSKERAKELYHELKSEKVKMGLMHSGLNDHERGVVMKNFRLGQTWGLICTDLMSRGIDFQGVNLVVNYDLPQSVVSYIHRIGRAGRAGRESKAVTLYTFDDAPYLKMVVNVMKRSGIEMPEWMKNLKTPSRKHKKNLEKKPIKRESISRKPKLSRTLRKNLKKQKDKANKNE